jgi:hypothetical protein
VFVLKHYNLEKQYAINGAVIYSYAMKFVCRNGHSIIDPSITFTAHGSGRVLLLLEPKGGDKVFTTFQTYINHKVLEIQGKGSHCSKKPAEKYSC